LPRTKSSFLLVATMAVLIHSGNGSAKLKQMDFRIQPATIGGVSIKVKDQIEMKFDIYGAQANS